MGLALEITPAALIPRPETEELVEEALRWLNGSGSSAPEILEIGTGSGNIALALGKFLPGARVMIDGQERGRARPCPPQCGAAQSPPTWSSSRGTFSQPEFATGSFDAVVANPPYVPASEFRLLEPEVRDFEPSMATTDGADGLEFIRRIAAVASTALRAGGGMFVEIGYGQADAARAIALDAGLTDVRVKTDFAGIGRILFGARPAGGGAP